MSQDLIVGSITIPDLLSKLHAGRYVVPEFQREFVWQISQIEALGDSIVRRRPIGMATLWEIGASDEGEELELSPIEIVDRPKAAQFGNVAEKGDRYAILDRRQRCTALAMIFGGLAPADARCRGAGKFYLDLTAGDGEKRVIFKKAAQIAKENIGAPASALARGLMPLAIEGAQNKDWDPRKTWEHYIKLLTLKQIYEDGKAPSERENESRTERISDALAGISSVRLATYTLGSRFDLADICEIFETLNTTGVQVSTADLIHSHVYRATKLAGNEPVSIRDWMDELGALPGAVGWSSGTDKPERIAQIATAAYVGLQTKSDPRKLRGVPNTKVSSIKANDLLRTPADHWLKLRFNQDVVAELLGKFQNAVADNFFPMKHCPYPATAAVYMGLAWSRHIESVEEDACWSFSELDALFRAFFWRNALLGRYDQGFLTKVGTDISELRGILRIKKAHTSFSGWVKAATPMLEKLFDKPLPLLEEVEQWCADGNETGARRDAMRLLLWTKTKVDIASGENLPAVGSANVELHHLWPKKWIGSNRTGALKTYLEKATESGTNPVDSAANLVPLLATSNKIWSAKTPSQAFNDRHCDYDSMAPTFDRAFISKHIFSLLMKGDPKSCVAAIRARANLIAEELLRRTGIWT